MQRDYGRQKTTSPPKDHTAATIDVNSCNALSSSITAGGIVSTQRVIHVALKTLL